MSAKRELYKSANVETDTPKTNRRRALAQGRLVTDPPGYDMIPKVTSETKSSPNVSLLSSSMMARMSLTKSHLDSSKADSMLHDSMQSSLLQKSRIENFETLAEKAQATTPRRGIPVSHQSPSPAVLQPSVSLDLSDAESETQPCNDVIKVDATKMIAFPAESNSPVRTHSGKTTQSTEYAADLNYVR
ncbi:hypothetical protein CAPTEDRAFT_202788 [Capitella teleta]|uniref:Uncharacterized protein n=1 Tax=Capitella teleta TaxID=283909 RepID=R7URN0_CAPTE|nr:hypothetical protein CAPTEDRAFT_202788 [Capitella teleta]|eukprot:ELU09174.1 hypothetical protein CAPTEDRAFT_202788 [Capitella teleta]